MKPPPRVRIYYGTSVYTSDGWEFGVYWGRRLNPPPGEWAYNRAVIIRFRKPIRVYRR